MLSNLLSETATVLLPFGGAIFGAAGAYYGVRHMARDATREAREAKRMAEENRGSLSKLHVDVAEIKGSVEVVKTVVTGLRGKHDDLCDQIRADRKRLDDTMKEFNHELRQFLLDSIVGKK
jgi:iron uptake system EfeUOB component EfeO/EfeM